jgi:hypothetical protein
MSPTRGRMPVSFCRHMVVCRQALALGSFSTLKSSLSHPVPSRLARGIARKLSHLLAVGGVSQKFISRVHRGHETLTLVSWPPYQTPYICVTKMGKKSFLG